MLGKANILKKGQFEGLTIPTDERMPTWKSELKSKPGRKFVFADVSFLIPDLIVGIPITKARWDTF